MNTTVKYLLKSLMRFLLYFLILLPIIFILIKSLPGNPYLFNVGEHMTGSQQAWYDQQVILLGLDKPIIIQFFIWIGNLFSGNFGTSLTIANNTPVIDLIGQKLPKTFELLVITLFISVPLGFLIGHFSGKHQNSVFDYIFRGLCYLGLIIIPVSLGLGLQYLFAIKTDFLPGTNYFDIGVGYIGTPYASVKPIIGLPLLDFLLHGRFDLWWSTLKHLIMPLFCLNSVMTSIIALQVRGDKIKTLSDEEDFYPRITKYSIDFNIFLIFIIVVSSVFNLKGGGQLLIASIQTQDYGVSMVSMLIFILILIVANFLIEVAYGIYFTLRKSPTLESSEKLDVEFSQDETNYEIDEPHFGEGKQTINSPLSLSSIKNKINFPLVIVGGSLLLALGILALLLPVIFDKEALLYSVFPTYFEAPSAEHIWGTTNFGRDVFGRTLWGLRPALGGGLASVLIGAIFGIPLGFLAGYYRKWADRAIMGTLGILFFIPIYVVTIIRVSFIGASMFNSILIIGEMLIPIWAWLTRETLISNKEKTIQKEEFIIKMLANFCLILWITICLMFLISFVGFGDSSIASWGIDVNNGRRHLADAPWSAFYPAFFPSILGLILMLLHFGLTTKKKA
ncbi:MAG: ABC transporter permease subunit [Promethearchaeota archaeon]